MTLLGPPDDHEVVYEFYSPFAHVPGKYEWCRIRSPTHGAFDVFILLGGNVHEAATVYVGNDAGEAFMGDRYPECTRVRVPRHALRVEERSRGYVVAGRLTSDNGPVREAIMTITAPETSRPRIAPYGGEGRPVWGSIRWTCSGVDLVLDARVRGHIRWTGRERREELEGEAVVTLGSFGRISPLASG